MDKVIAELRRLADGGEPDFQGYGICGYLNWVAGVNYTWVEDVLGALGLHRKYPLDDGGGLTPKDQYKQHARGLTLWVGRQGELRRALCARMADYLEGKT